MTELSDLSAFAQLQLLKSGEVTPRYLSEYYQSRIAANPELGAFVTVTPEVTEALLERLPTNRTAPLWGLPHGDKDLANRPGVPTLFGSLAVAQEKRQAQSLPDLPADRIVVESDRLGLISLGKTNTPEFGLFGYTESYVSAAARHPQDLSLNAGGSSGGAAVAVAAGLLPAAMGSDGGGSVRIPAATVGLVGLKPGRDVLLPDRGTDTPTGVVSGPLTRDVRDAALFFAAFSGQVETNWQDYLESAPEKVRVGIATDSPWQPDFDLRLDSIVFDALEVGRVLLEPYAHSQWDISLQTPGYADMFQTAWFRAAGGLPPILNSELFHPTTRWLVSEGRELSAEAAVKNRAAVIDFQHSMSRRLEDVDILITPALGLGPQTVGSYPDHGPANFAKQVAYSPFTSWVNLMGWPALTVPVTRMRWGQAGEDLPFSIQIVGKPGREWDLLRFARRIHSSQIPAL